MGRKRDINKLKNQLDVYIQAHLIGQIEYDNRLAEPEIRYEAIRVGAMPSFNRELDDVMKHIDDTFQESLFYLIETKHLDDVVVYQKAHLDRRLFSKIRSDKNYKPSKKTALCLCMGLGLNLDETTDLLEKAGYTLSHSSKSDLIVEYFIKKHIYDLDVLNGILYDYGEEPLYI